MPPLRGRRESFQLFSLDRDSRYLLSREHPSKWLSRADCSLRGLRGHRVMATSAYSSG